MIQVHKTNRLQRWTQQLISAFLAFNFSLAILTANNPIWGYSGVDSACFAVMGRGILKGLVPYVDLIDNKGPVLYLLNALAQAPFSHLKGAGSTVGIWLMEIVLLFFSLRVIAWMCRQCKCRWSVALQILYLLMLLPLIETGNIGEEYSNCFTLFSFALIIKFENDYNENQYWQYGFYLGILFALSFFIRPNNALPIAALIFAMLIGLSNQKRMDIIFLNAGSFFAGTGLILGPILIYLGVNGAIGEWINQSIFVNLQYSGDSKSSFFSILFSKYGMTATGMFALTFVNVLLGWKKNGNNWKRKVLLMGIALGGAVSFYSAFISGFTYLHYLMIGTVPLLISTMLFIASEDIRQFLKKINQKSIHIRSLYPSIYMLIVLLFVLSLTVSQLFRFPDNLSNAIPKLKEYVIAGQYNNSEMIQLASKIPEIERDSVYILETGSTNNCNYYIQTGLLPSFRAFICVDRFCRLIPGLEREYLIYFNNNPPKWLLSDVAFDKLENIYLKQLLKENYKIVQTNAYNVSLYVYQP